MRGLDGMIASSGKLRAWIEQQHGGAFVAAFIGVATLPDGRVAAANREPARQVCCSLDKARQWVEKEATAFGLPVEWMEEPAGSC
jgi:hypothetical protein